MASLETTPAPIADAKRRMSSRKFLSLFLFAGLLLALVVAVLTIRSRTDPLQRRLIGWWKVQQPLPEGAEDRIVEFREDGRYLIYRKEKGVYEPESSLDGWRTSDGDLVLALTNPDPFAKNASVGQRVKDAVQIMADRMSGAYSDRYTAVADGEDAIEFIPQSKRVGPFSLRRMDELPR